MPDTPARTDPALQRVAIRNIGCKLNQYESEALSAGFVRAGFRLVDFDDEAEVYVVNTCTVTGAGDADSRRAVRRAQRRSPQAVIVATGCYAQRRPAELETAGANLLVSNLDKAHLVETVQARLSHRPAPPTAAHDVPLKGRGRTRQFLQIDRAVEGGRTRGTLQIQDGCDEHCTYCIIPQVRGLSISRPVVEVADQARRMVDAGYAELALTGVHTGSFGHDRQRPDELVELLRALEAIEGLRRIRLNSIEPNFVTDALIAHAATSDRLCRHYHIPLQSGDDDVLRRMGRRYTRREYADRVRRLADQVPGACLGADVMVGFPGESPAQFANTVDVLRDLPLAYLHVFSYSLRQGTPAEQLGDHTPGQVKSARARLLIEMSQHKRLAFHRRHVGQEVEVLIESPRRGDGTALAVGLTDNYIKVLVADGGTAQEPVLQPNQLPRVRIARAREDLVFGALPAVEATA